jgi:hypothetical protein
MQNSIIIGKVNEKKANIWTLQILVIKQLLQLYPSQQNMLTKESTTLQNRTPTDDLNQPPWSL